MTGTDAETKPERKGAYHHGSLREALIEAAYALISEHGVEGFTIADACRVAGVSTAAPYRHFADRGELIHAVCARGYERLAEKIRAARDAHPAGSEEALIAMGQAYVDFVVAAPNLFEVMWGAHEADERDPEEKMAGMACFGALLEAVDTFISTKNIKGLEADDVAVPLWTMVHGTASLHLGGRLNKTVPETDVAGMIDATIRAYLKGLVAPAGG